MIYPNIDDISFIQDANTIKKTEVNDLLFVRVGAGVGDCCVISEKEKGFAFSDNVIRVKLNGELNPYFISIFLNNHIGKTLFFKGLKGSGKPVISRENLEKIIFPLLDLNKQNEIHLIIQNATDLQTNKINEALELIKNVDEIIAEKIGFEFPKVEVKNTFCIKVSAFENRIDPHFYLPNFKALLDNIRKTKNAKLADLVEFSKESWNQKDIFENEFPYIEISEIDLSSGRINNVSLVPISEAPSRAKMVVRENDIIVSTTRPHRGAISLIEKDKDGYIASTGFAILRNLKTAEISKEYLFYMLRTQICLLQMLQRSSGGSYPAITAEELKNIYIPIPDKIIQQEIVNHIKAFIQQAEQLKEDAKAEFEKAKQEIEALILN
jgi:restriction endonuclease S subunit